ncbi:phosphotransferase [Actinomadura sp. 6N118]|uniref:phosphotransferase n=1 Tax=Actinomadura sp. 6N118 TaxID=3375151 RepID=UPI0037BE535F
MSALAPRLLFDVEARGWRLLGFEVLDARPIDYAPGSPDLPKLMDLIHRLQQVPRPDVTTLPFERRWSQLGDASVMAGDSLLHTDFNESNVLITDERAYLVDWAWSCKGAAWVDLAFLVVRLVAAGHTPAKAEQWVTQFPAWATAPPEGIDTFAALNHRLWERAIQRNARPFWVELAATAKTWTAYRGL